MAYELASALVRPLTFTLVLMVLAWLVARRQPAGRRATTALLLALLIVVCHPYMAWWLMQTLERPFFPPGEVPRDVSAIVVLSGGIRKEPSGRFALADDSTARTLHAADIYRAIGRRTVVVTGGIASSRPDRPPVAPLMRDLLVKLGVAEGDIVVEGRSRTTYENAVQTSKILVPLGKTRIALVTEAHHLKRSVVVFRAQGLDVVPAGCSYTGSDPPELPISLLPDAGAALKVQRAAHEWLGLAWYWLKGRAM